jgi:hypothetical protein
MIIGNRRRPRITFWWAKNKTFTASRLSGLCHALSFHGHMDHSSAVCFFCLGTNDCIHDFNVKNDQGMHLSPSINARNWSWISISTDLPLTQAFSRDDEFIAWQDSPSTTSTTHEMLHVHWSTCSRHAASMSCWQPSEVGNCCIFPSNVDLFNCLFVHVIMVYLTLLPVAQTTKVKKKG